MIPASVPRHVWVFEVTCGLHGLCMSGPRDDAVIDKSDEISKQPEAEPGE
jgi:hypothetical protein